MPRIWFSKGWRRCAGAAWTDRAAAATRSLLREMDAAAALVAEAGRELADREAAPHLPFLPGVGPGLASTSGRRADDEHGMRLARLDEDLDEDLDAGDGGAG